MMDQRFQRLTNITPALGKSCWFDRISWGLEGGGGQARRLRTDLEEGRVHDKEWHNNPLYEPDGKNPEELDIKSNINIPWEKQLVKFWRTFAGWVL